MKEKRIKSEKEKLQKVYKSTSDKEILTRLIERAAMLLVMIEDMEKEILMMEGFTTKIINASQEFIKANPLLKDYRETVKSYQAVLKQIRDITSKEEIETTDELEGFIKS